jgi:hypothetical protein
MSRTTPGISQRLGQSLFRRTASCVETQGGQFEHFSFIVRVLEHDSSCIWYFFFTATCYAQRWTLHAIRNDVRSFPLLEFVLRMLIPYWFCSDSNCYGNICPKCRCVFSLLSFKYVTVQSVTSLNNYWVTCLSPFHKIFFALLLNVIFLSRIFLCNFPMIYVDPVVSLRCKRMLANTLIRTFSLKTAIYWTPAGKQNIYF